MPSGLSLLVWLPDQRARCRMVLLIVAASGGTG
jgi:hypothetical protein